MENKVNVTELQGKPPMTPYELIEEFRVNFYETMLSHNVDLDELITWTMKNKLTTPLREIIEFETSCSYMFDSDHRIAMALLDYVRKNKTEFLEKERKSYCDFFYLVYDEDEKFSDSTHEVVGKEYDKLFNSKNTH